MTRRTATRLRNGSDAKTAAERLADVRAEIAELEAPLPANAPVDADIDALASMIAARVARREALLLTVPALERAELAERLVAIDTELERAGREVEATARTANEVEARAQQVIAERVEAVAVANGAMANQAWWLRERELLVEALRVHDERHAQPVMA